MPNKPPTPKAASSKSPPTAGSTPLRVKSLKYYGPQHLVAAVLDTLEFLHARAGLCSSEWCDDTWVLHPEQRAELVKGVAAHWANRTKQAWTAFPFSDYAVTSLFRRLQKVGPKFWPKWRAELLADYKLPALEDVPLLKEPTL